MEVHVNQIEKRSWIEIDLAQLKANYLIYKKKLKTDADIMAVIKADAYGHGDVQVARMLSWCGCHLFAVSNIDEAVGLREAGVQGEILLLGYSSPFYAKTLVDYDLTQAIVSEEYAEALASTPFKVKCQFAIDTGMNRIGLNGDDSEQCERIIRHYAERLHLNGMFTHLCVADTDTEECRAFTWGQINKFKSVAERIADLHLPYVHCCNSAAGLNYLDGSEKFDLIGGIVRLGIILFGLKPSPETILPEGIAPAIAWKSAISQVKDVYPGETIGYGRTFKVERKSRIATVTTGYADGLNRHLSNRGHVLIRGHRAPIVGRICMDQTLVDVTDIPEVAMGDKVVVLGRDGDLQYTADDMAEDLGTIGYEVLCTMSKRVQRFYVSSNSSL
jgi:alanine racemase